MTVRVEVSDRESEVLVAVAAGRSNAQIANRLHISVRTVEGDVSSLLRKYGVADRRALAEIAADLPGVPSPGAVTGLPGWRTTFVGRVAEQAAVAAALADSRLVTLVGPGGVGKTRLAARAAEHVPTGGAFVDLAPARAGSVPRVVATVLGVVEAAHQPLDAAILARLRRGEDVLVLDNCEHVIEAAARLVEEILSACPSTRVLVTSRERLAVAGERVVPVGPLPLGSDAEELFAERAEVTAADRAAVASVCAQVDGLPLAIELVAARYGGLGAEGVLAGSATGYVCSPAAAAQCSGTARRGPCWAGATTCWTPRNASCSGCSGRSPASSTWRPWRRSVRRSPQWRPTCWADWWTRVS